MQNKKTPLVNSIFERKCTIIIITIVSLVNLYQRRNIL